MHKCIVMDMSLFLITFSLKNVYRIGYIKEKF